MLNFMRLIDKFYTYLVKNGMTFSGEYPTFNKDMFISEEPELLVPFYYRNHDIVKSPSKTALCLFENDGYILRRFDNLFENIPTYSKFAGVTGFDFTITSDMDVELQKSVILLNRLADAVLAINDVKISANLRIGSNDTVSCLDCFPKNIYCSSGFLGCDKLKSEYDFSFISKVLHILPSKLLIYGKHDKIAEKQLTNMGIDYRIYADMHRLTKGVA